MPCEENQCCAITLDNKRCSNTVYHDSNHCKAHYPKAMKLYKEYKGICNVAYDLDIERDKGPDIEKDIRYFLKCYIWLNRAFDARIKHRKYAFVPECYDYGHDKQFEIIQEKLNKCESVLSKLYEEYKTAHMISDTPTSTESSNYGGDVKSDDSDDDNRDYDDTITKSDNYAVSLVPKKIKKYNKKRMQREENIDNIMNQYMKKNQEVLERRDKLINIILKTIKQQYHSLIEVDDDNIFILTMIIHHLTKTLYEIGYYVSDYKPQRCKDCCCGNYICYDVRLGCGCFYRYDEVKEYLNVMTEHTLRMFFEVLLRNQDKTKPILADMVWFYKLYGDSLLNIEIEGIWDDKKNRLILRVAEYITDKKPSRSMSRLRMKKKVLKRILEKEEEFDIDSSDDE